MGGQVQSLDKDLSCSVTFQLILLRQALSVHLELGCHQVPEILLPLLPLGPPMVELQACSDMPGFLAGCRRFELQLGPPDWTASVLIHWNISPAHFVLILECAYKQTFPVKHALVFGQQHSFSYILFTKSLDCIERMSNTHPEACVSALCGRWGHSPVTGFSDCIPVNEHCVSLPQQVVQFLNSVWHGCDITF